MKMTVMAKGLQFTSTAQCKKKKSKYKGPRDKQNMKIYSGYKLAFKNVSIKKYTQT